MIGYSLNRRQFIKKFTALGVTAAIPHSLAAEVSDQSRKPNIVLIMADDFGYECLKAYGGSSYKTPQIDKLAETGVRFEHCYSLPICTPSRVQLMTGKYSIRNYDGFGVLPRNQVTFAHQLQKRGYTTGIMGKWQLGHEKDSPKHFGFDESCLWKHTHAGRKDRYINPHIDINGELMTFANGEYGPDIINDYACRFIQSNRHKPFFLYYPMLLPHYPFGPTPASADWNPSDSYPKQKIKLPRKDGKDQKYFGEMVNYMDRAVGNLINRLDQFGLRDNTLILFLGDNGTAKSISSTVNGKTVKGGKKLMTDAGTHVPLIANWHGVIRKGGIINDLVDFTDILPTLIDVTGVDIPAYPGVDGRSFLPQMLGEVGNPRKWVYCWFRKRDWVRNQRYKLYRSGEFYDVKNDVLEEMPLGDVSPETEKVKRMLQKVLEQFKKEHPGRLM